MIEAVDIRSNEITSLSNIVISPKCGAQLINQRRDSIGVRILVTRYHLES